MKFKLGSTDLELVLGDLTEQSCDAIVNAANERLAGGGGVDGAIHRRGGPDIMRETNEKYPEGCATGDAVVSGGGRLPCRYVVHTVGPVWRGGQQGERERLAAAYRNSLCRADENDCRSIAFPAISCGVYGYPLNEAAKVALQTVSDYVSGPTQIETIRFVLFAAPALEAYEQAARSLGFS